jgi:hypothetical protein
LDDAAIRSGTSFSKSLRFCAVDPTGVAAFPRDNLTVTCTLCGEVRRYRSSEVYLGFPDSHLIQQQVSITRQRKGAEINLKDTNLEWFEYPLAKLRRVE